MNKFNFMCLLFCVIFSVQGCSKVLEPVSLVIKKNDIEYVKSQENFEVNIKELTFQNSLVANKDFYPRQIMINGSGSNANVFNEADFLNTSIPTDLPKSDYLIGVGDELYFEQLKKFIVTKPNWPPLINAKEYLLGIGDILSFTKIMGANDVAVSLDSTTGGFISASKENDTLYTTSSAVGSNGNILLLGMGNIKANNRTLDQVRNELRSMLIRNGSTPNFQLEISEFNSKNVFINYPEADHVINVPLTNRVMNLKDVILTYNLLDKDDDEVIIIFRRDNIAYRFTAKQIFHDNSPEVILKNKDEITIKVYDNLVTTTTATVGSKGEIFFPTIGNLNVKNRTLNDVFNQIESILIKKGNQPNFKLEISNFRSKKAYLVDKSGGNFIIPLSSDIKNLKELLISIKSIKFPLNSLSLVTIKRDNQLFRLTLDKVLDTKTPDIWIKDRDQIELEHFPYKPGKVYALSGAGKALILPIEPSKRETLANILFAPGGALSNLSAKRSEIYLLRGKKPTTAYHLDAQNVSRILVAANTELRPNDIIYVADRPIISFNRLLGEISPLRTLLRDIDQGNIP